MHEVHWQLRATTECYFSASRFTVEQKLICWQASSSNGQEKESAHQVKGKGLKERSSLGVYTWDAERKGAVLAGRPQGPQQSPTKTTFGPVCPLQMLSTGKKAWEWLSQCGYMKRILLNADTAAKLPLCQYGLFSTKMLPPKHFPLDVNLWWQN